MILVGELSLWVALLMAAWAGVTSYAGGALGREDLVTSGRRGLYATTLLAKCASRYENAPDAEKYKQTPGYKAGAKA